MVFTHLPSSLFLIDVPFAPSFKWAVLLFLCREAVVEMDVPTRQSYVAAVVLPNERKFASGLTNLARNVFWAGGSSRRRPSHAEPGILLASRDWSGNQGRLRFDGISSISEASTAGGTGQIAS